MIELIKILAHNICKIQILGIKVEDYSFGQIKIEDKEYTYDLRIINGEIYKRDKGLSKRLFWTSHRIPKEEKGK